MHLEILMETALSSYFFFLSETVKKDIEKLKTIAKEGEEEYNRNLPTPPVFGPGEIPTTIPPNPTHFEHAFVQPSRCTIPLAMTCLSLVELLGNLISNSKTQGFQNGAKQFFKYAEISISNPERELLREIYRNGVMHKFFPHGVEIGITYDSTLETQMELIVENKNRIILNVNFLSKTVLEVLSKLSADSNKQQTIEKKLQTVTSQELNEIQKIINSYKKDRLKKSKISCIKLNNLS